MAESREDRADTSQPGTVGLVILAAGVPLDAAAQGRNDDVLIKGATVMTAARGTLANTDILVRNGKINRIAANIAAPSGVRVIDATESIEHVRAAACAAIDAFVDKQETRE